MNDLKTLYNAINKIKVPIEKPEALESNKALFDEYAHTPYVDESVKMPEYPEQQSEGPEQSEESGSETDPNVEDGE